MPWRRGEGVLCAPVLNEILFLIHAHRLRYGSDRVARQFEALAARRFSETILPFDEAAARACASVRAEQAVRGRTRPASDMPIAGICLVHDLPLATRNVRHFQGIGLDIINPFEAA